MDGRIKLISPSDLYGSIGSAGAPLIIDVRKADAFDEDGLLIASAIRRLPDAVGRWRSDIGANRSQEPAASGRA